MLGIQLPILGSPGRLVVAVVKPNKPKGMVRSKPTRKFNKPPTTLPDMGGLNIEN